MLLDEINDYLECRKWMLLETEDNHPTAWERTVYKAMQQMIINGQVVKQEPQPIRLEVRYFGDGECGGDIFEEYIFTVNGLGGDVYCVYTLAEFEDLYKKIFNGLENE